MLGIRTWPVGASRSDGLSRRACVAVVSLRELNRLESRVLCADAASSEANLMVADRRTRLWELLRDEESVCKSASSSRWSGLNAGWACWPLLPRW